MNNIDRNYIDRFIGLGVAVVALAVYIGTLSVGAYPGDSATLIVQATGLAPEISPDNPFWTRIVFLVSKLLFGSLALNLNVFSALCGAASIWLLYQIVSGTVYNAITVNPVNRSRVVVASRLAGIVSALSLAFCIPFWVASNRAHIASFDILLLLGVTRLFLGFINTRSRIILLLFAFLYGLSVVEFATMIILAPLFGCYLLLDLWKNEELNFSLIWKVVLSALVGLSMYFVAAWSFYGSEGYELRGYTGYFNVVWFMWRDQYLLISRSLPREGWLLIVFFTIAPWLTSLLVARRALNEEKDWTYYMLHAVITGLVLYVMLNGPVAPWPMLGFRRFLVTPYVLTAAVFGYLAAYWYLLPYTLWGDSESPTLARLGSRLGIVFALCLIILACMLPFKNVAQSNGSEERPINAYAREVIKSLAPEQKWLITDGVIDDLLLIAARDMGRPLKLLNLRNGDNEIYIKYIVRHIDRPRLQNMARIGLFPMLQEWVQIDPEAPKNMAVMWPPDIWVGAGYSAVPRGLVYNGVKTIRQVDGDALLADNRRVSVLLVPVIKDAAKGGSFSVQATNLLRTLSMLTVNLGVVMEDLDRKDDAFRLYSDARNIFPDNLSALLNLSAMVDGGYKTEKAESIRKDLKALLSLDLSKRPDVWTLSRIYGYVRTPEAFGRLGLGWSMSGQPGYAVAGIKRAIDLMPAGKRGGAKQLLADVYLNQQHDDEGEALYYELLVENPANAGALMGMARVSARKSDFKLAMEYLKKAEKAGVPKSTIAVEMASLNLRCGNLEQVRAGLEEVVDLKMEGTSAPTVERIWLMLMGVYAQQTDQKALEGCVKRIQENNLSSQHLALLANGHLELVKKNLPEARKNFENALRSNPNNATALELLLRMDVLEAKKKEAGEHVRKLLTLDPKNAIANYIRGSIQFAGGDLVLAEDSYRRSLERGKSPRVMNDLAWLLQKKGSFQEAEKLAREALKMEEHFSAAWDSLGVILMKTGKYDEAEKSFERSIALTPKDMSAIVHMAQLQVLKGNGEKAIELIGKIPGKPSQFTDDGFDEIEKVRKALDGM